MGNRTREITTVSGSATSDKTLVYDQRDRLTSTTDSLDPGNNATYSYNPNGNLTSADEGGVAKNFTYDQRDRLVQATEDGSPVLTARYDWQGRRIEKDGAVGMRKYLWDGDRLLSEHDESGATLTTHYTGLPSLTAPPLASFNTAAGWSFLHEDALGSVIATTALSSSVAERTSYDAWGNTVSQSGFAAHDFGFTAHLRDSETNTLYARARDYDPNTGRFLTEDPFAGRLTDPPTQHPYLYARANPTTYVDPSGRVPFDPGRAALDTIAQAAAERRARHAAQCSASGGRGAFCGGFGQDLLDLAQLIGETTATVLDEGIPSVADYLFGDLVDARERLASEGRGLSQRLDAAQRSSGRGVEEMATLLAQGRDPRLEDLEGVTRSAGRVTEAGGRVVVEGVESAEKVAVGAFAVRATKALARRISARSGRGAGNQLTSPWLADPRTAVVEHLERFRGGGSYLVPEAVYRRFGSGQGPVGRIDGQFITTRAAMDRLLLETGGDLQRINQRLGVRWRGKLVRVDIHDPLLHNARLPSGLETGAELFRWGGYTSGGLPEIVIDQVPLGGFSVSTFGR